QERVRAGRTTRRMLVACSSAIGTHEHPPTFSDILNATKLNRVIQLNPLKHSPVLGLLTFNP
ncbi:hypothetical protein, partial [Nonomuraea sp. bgisy101]